MKLNNKDTIPLSRILIVSGMKAVLKSIHRC